MGLLDQLPQGGLLAGMSQQDKALMLLQMGAATLANNTGNYGRAGPAIGAGLGAGANYMAQGPERAYKAMQMKQFEEKMKQEAREREQAEAANNDWKAAIGDNSHLSDDPNFAPGGLLAGTPMPQSQFGAQSPAQSFALKMAGNDPSMRAPLLKSMLETPEGTGLGKLIRERDSLPPGDPRRIVYDAAINKETQFAPPATTTVYSTSLVPGVDASGNSVYVQPSKEGGASILSNVRPPKPEENAQDRAARIAAEQFDKELAATEAMARKIEARIRGNKGSVGVPGAVRRGVEAVTGSAAALSGGTEPATPAIDIDSEMEALKAQAIRTFSGGGNIAKHDREALERAAGGKYFTTPDAKIRGVYNVVNTLRAKRGLPPIQPTGEGGPPPGAVRRIK